MKPKGQRKECIDCIEQVHGICLHEGWCPLKKKKQCDYGQDYCCEDCEICEEQK